MEIESDNAEFIVIALTGTLTQCSILPKDAIYPAIYTQVFGPATRAECQEWIKDNCGGARE